MTGLEPFAPTPQSIHGLLDQGFEQNYQNHALTSGRCIKHGFNPSANDVDTFRSFGDALCPVSKSKVAKYQVNEQLSGRSKKFAQKRNIGLILNQTISKANKVDQILLRASTVREGRSFTVSNVANKGKIYLR